MLLLLVLYKLVINLTQLLRKFVGELAAHDSGAAGWLPCRQYEVPFFEVGYQVNMSKYMQNMSTNHSCFYGLTITLNIWCNYQ